MNQHHTYFQWIIEKRKAKTNIEIEMLLRVFPNKNSIAACLLDKFNSIQFTWMLNEKKRSALEMAINKWILVHYFHGMTFFQATIIFEFWINWCQKHFNRCVQSTENPFSWYTLNPNTITKMIFQLKLFCCKMYYNKKASDMTYDSSLNGISSERSI